MVSNVISDEAKLVDLASQDLVSPILQRNWLQNSGYDPVKVAMVAVAQEKRWKWLRYVHWIVAALYLATIFVVFEVLKLNDADAKTVLTSAVCVLVIVAVVFCCIFDTGRTIEPTKPNGPVGSFWSHLEDLSTWAGVAVEGFRTMDENTLNQNAKRVLIEKACDILRLQDANAEVPTEFWAGDKNRLTDELKRRSRVLRELGLFDGPYGPVFERARALIARTP